MSEKRESKKTKVQLQPKSPSKVEQTSIDEIDMKILRILNWDARLSYREIARQTKLSTGTVIARLNKLRKEGVINGYSVNINPKKLGFGLTAIIEVIAPKISLMQAMRDIKELPNIQGIYHLTGDVDIIIMAKFKSIEHLQNFLNELYKKEDIQRTHTRIVLDTLKEDFRIII
ncbi:MAG: Lrp/AsnC family transcriptional regulator [Candidatus Aenigmatarchaeota archaeon]|nr:Lrp/AsnC family transcriptional regulator [Candidatus Aenigmarchaeota archaeon]